MNATRAYTQPRTVVHRPGNPADRPRPAPALPACTATRSPCRRAPTHGPFGRPAMPRTCTRRVSSSSTKNTNSRRNRTVSTWKKSQASSPCACARSRVLPRQPQHEITDFGGDQRTPRRIRVCPVRGEQRSICPRHAWTCDLTTQHGNLVTQCQNLGVLHDFRSPPKNQPPEHPHHQQIDQPHSPEADPPVPAWAHHRSDTLARHRR
jgi:hypothetical protein